MESVKVGDKIRQDLTEYPIREFVKQRIVFLSEELPERKTLIYDNAPQFLSIDFDLYDIKGVNICLAAPNMNAFTERLVGIIRRDALDHLLLFSENQVRKILTEYIDYFNHLRSHQGTEGIPEENFLDGAGSIKKRQILDGLHHHYYRSSA